MLNVDVMQGNTMEQAGMWNFIYVLPTSTILLAIGGVFFAAKIKTRWATTIAIGTSIASVAILIQRYVPVHRARLNEAGEIIASGSMSLIRHLSGFMFPVGIILIAIGLFWGAMNSNKKSKA